MLVLRTLMFVGLEHALQVGQLVGACRSREFTDMIVVQETRGEPDGLIVCHLPLGPTAFFTLSNCVLRHDIADRGTVSEVYPHLILDKFSTALGQRVANVLKHLFPVPKVNLRSVVFPLLYVTCPAKMSATAYCDVHISIAVRSKV